MVTTLLTVQPAVTVFLAQQAAQPLLERLDPPRRAAVVMALLGLVLTGLLLVTIVMVGAHWVRRQARHKPRAPDIKSSANAAASNRQLRASLGSILPDVKTSDTVQANRSTGDTKADS
jgi:hypothetical protein